MKYAKFCLRTNGAHKLTEFLFLFFLFIKVFRLQGRYFVRMSTHARMLNAYVQFALHTLIFIYSLAWNRKNFVNAAIGKRMNANGLQMMVGCSLLRNSFYKAVNSSASAQNILRNINYLKQPHDMFQQQNEWLAAETRLVGVFCATIMSAIIKIKS